MLNTEHFVVLAGDPSKWDEEIRQAKAQPNPLGPRDPDFNLCHAQVNQHARGRMSATLWQNVFGWAVGYDSNRAVIRGGRQEPGWTVEQAIAAGIEWANKDPANREFYVRRADVRGMTFTINGVETTID